MDLKKLNDSTDHLNFRDAKSNPHTHLQSLELSALTQGQDLISLCGEFAVAER